MKNKNYNKVLFKIPFTRINIIRGNKYSVIAGMIAGLAAYGISSLIFMISGIIYIPAYSFEGITFIVIVLVFSLIIANKLEKPVQQIFGKERRMKI